MRFDRFVRARRLLAAALAVGLFPVAAQADVWWATTTGGAWGTPGSWTTTAAGAADGVTTPTAADIVTFMGTTPVQTGAVTITLDGTREAKGLAMNTSSDFVTTLDGGSSNSVLNLGTSGINLPANSVGITIGSITDGKKVTVNLQGSQSWSSSGTTQAIFVLNDVTLANAGAQTLTLSGSNTGTKIDGVISNGAGTLSITKSGSGTWALNGANTYTGITTISAAQINIAQLANGGVASGIGMSSSDAANLVFGSTGVLAVTGAGGSTDRAFTMTGTSMALNASATAPVIWTNTSALVFGGTNAARSFGLRGSSTQANSFAGLIADNTVAFKTAFTKNDGGRWILANNNNSYTGVTTINAGTVAVNTLANGGTISALGAATSDAANLLLGLDGATPTAGILQYIGTGNSSTDRAYSIRTNNSGFDASGTGSITFTNTAEPLWGVADVVRTFLLTGTSTADNAIAATIDDNGTGAVSINKTGTGKWILTGTNTNTGTTTVTAGTLGAGSNSAFGTGALSITNGTVDLGANRTLSTGSVTLNGTGSIIGANTSSLATTGTFELQNGTVSAILAGSGLVNKTTANNVTLSGANTFTSVVTISAGTLVANHAQALGATSAKTNIVSGASLAVGNGITAGSGETVDLQGPGVGNNGGITALAGIAGTWAGTTELSGDSPRFGAWLNGTLTVSGPIVDGTSLTGQELYINGQVGAGTPGTVVIATPAGQNTFTAPIFIARGTMKLGADNTLPTGVTVDVHYSNSNLTEVATLDLNGFNQTVGALNNGGGAGSTATSIVTNSNVALKTLTINALSASTYSGTISGNLGLTKTGTANVTLSGVNTFTGPTQVSGGSLIVSGTNPIGSSSLIQVDAGATLATAGVTGGFILGTAQTLAGSGTVTGNVTLAAGANLAPGNSPGTLTFTGNLDLSATGGSNSGDLSFELGTASDLVNLTTGTLTIGTNLGFNDFNFLAGPGFGEGSYTLFNSSATIAGTLDAANLTGVIGGYTGTLGLGDSGRDLVLTVTAIPEPSTMVLAGLGLLGFAGLRMRRRKLAK